MLSYQELQSSLLRQQHIEFVRAHNVKQETLDFYATEHLRLSGAYWGCMALSLLSDEPQAPVDCKFRLPLYFSAMKHMFEPNLDNSGQIKPTATGGTVEELVDWVWRCQRPDGGFGGNVGHHSHVLFTLSALQVLALCDRLHRVSLDIRRKIATCTDPGPSVCRNSF